MAPTESSGEIFSSHIQRAKEKKNKNEKNQMGIYRDPLRTSRDAFEDKSQQLIVARSGLNECMNLAETAWLISRVINAWVICVSISQRTVKIGWAFLNSQRWMTTFVEFMASSVLTAIMTYANWRLSAEMSLFSKKNKMGGGDSVHNEDRRSDN